MNKTIPSTTKNDTLTVKTKDTVLSFYKNMLRFQIHYPILSMLLLAGIGLGVLYECLVPLIFKWLFNVVLIHKNIALLSLVAGLLLLCFIFLVISVILQVTSSAKLGEKYINFLRYEIFKKIQSIPLDDSRAEYHQSNLVSYFSDDINNIENVAAYMMWNALRYFIMSIVGTVLLIYFDWRMTLLTLIFLPLTVFLPHTFAKKTREILKLKRSKENDLLKLLQENITRQDIIRFLKLKHYTSTKFKKKLQYVLDISYAYQISASFTVRTSYLSFNFSRLLVLFIGAYFVVTNQLTAGSLIGFIILLGTVNNSVTSVFSLYPLLNRSSNALNNIQRFLEKKIVPLYQGDHSMPPLAKNIYFENVSLSYDDHPVLSKINFKVDKGQLVAVVGRSGSGKTTLIKTILQQIAPQSGDIWIDDLNLKQINSYSLFLQIGIVLQQPKLFNISIRENIRMGRLAAADNEIIQAAKQAEIHDEIMQLPHQYNTIIGDSGLSMGQNQRIALAQVLIAKPSILLLDEATSALDPITSNAIVETIGRMKGSFTIIMISHRLNAVINADQIWVMHQGEFIEHGTHRQLLQLNGHYKQLWDKQNGFILSSDAKEIFVIPMWLKRILLFSYLSDPELNELAQYFVIERYEKDTIVFNSGEIGDKFYILVSGQVQVIRADQNGITRTVATLIDGDFFGEIALLFDQPRTATIKTVTNCIFLTLHYQQFHKIFQTLPKNTQDFLIATAKERLLTKAP